MKIYSKDIIIKGGKKENVEKAKEKKKPENLFAVKDKLN